MGCYRARVAGDNAVMESFFSSLKKERIRKRIYKTRDMARAEVFDYIEVFYTVIWAESAPRHLRTPGREAGICLPNLGQSTSPWRTPAYRPTWKVGLQCGQKEERRRPWSPV
ncbi:hypothetical protein GCM10027082_47280 [Comamonas humi]